MNKIPIVSLLMLLCVILVIRIIYKWWSARQSDSAIRRRPDKPVAQKRAAAEPIANSPLQPPPVAPVVPPPVPVVPTPAPRITRDAAASIHDDETPINRPRGAAPASSATSPLQVRESGTPVTSPPVR